MGVHVLPDYNCRVTSNFVCLDYHSVIVALPELGTFGFRELPAILLNNHFLAIDSTVLSVKMHLNACVFNSSLFN
jgi:hypothetical protein